MSSTAEPPRHWHRGDRVIALPNNQRAVVEGWKDGRLLLFFGTIGLVPVRAWYPEAAVVFEEHGPPYIPTPLEAKT